jgi:hypothetical protein
MATATTVDFRRMTIPERVYHLETEGYVILPDILSGNDVERIKAELESLPMRPSFYSDAPTFASQPPHTYSVACSDLIATLMTRARIELPCGYFRDHTSVCMPMHTPTKGIAHMPMKSLFR